MALSLHQAIIPNWLQVLGAVDGLLDKAEGYVATIKNGKVTFRDGEWTGETPGGLIRGPQRVELLEAAE